MPDLALKAFGSNKWSRCGNHNLNSGSQNWVKRLWQIQKTVKPQKRLSQKREHANAFLKSHNLKQETRIITSSVAGTLNSLHTKK